MSNIKIEINTIEKVNLALLQNNVPVIQEIYITNESENDVQNVSIEIESDPKDAIMGKLNVSLIRSNETYTIEKPELNHSWDFFNNCNEKILGSIKVKVQENDIDLTDEIKKIEFTSSDTWLGNSAPIELLASYVMPNNPQVSKIIKNASEILKQNTGDGSLNGYQSNDSSRVYSIIQSIYLALRNLKLTYAEPPASFEKTGQKIRTVEDIVNQGLGTCLDTTLLYCACLEQCGLNSIVFLIKGHSFAGVWLENKHLPRAYDEDGQFFRKRKQLDELTVFETTGITQPNFISFSELEKRAVEYLENDEPFLYGLDIKYCRTSEMIFPINESNKGNIEKKDVKEDASTDGAKFEEKAFDKVEISEKVYARNSELEKWQDKLLDLTFRNKLLNFRTTSSTVKIECNNPAEMEDILADGSSFELLPKHEENVLEIERKDKDEVLKQRIQSGFEKKKLITNLPANKFKTVLNSIFRNIRNVQEETGANTLFLSLGILEWTETDGSEKIRKSPLLLLPIEIKKKFAGGRFSITMRDDDTVLNHTLLQKFVRDFDLKFPGLDPLPEDDSGVDVPKIFNIIRTVIKDKRGWEVKEEVWLSEFTFQKYLMWKELVDHYEQMLLSPVVNRVMENSEDSSEASFIAEEKVEDHLPPEKVYCPLSADSSQLAAIFSAAEGKSFVLQGPPGTGKSQTITNMIAHCLAHSKRVLFVSEKKVALEVVYKRLQSIGLGPFCLELHSKKSEKKAVAQSFYEALEYFKKISVENWLSISNNLKNSREVLNQYFKELHDDSNGGISAYRAFTKSDRAMDGKALNFNTKKVFALNQSDVRNITESINSWVATASILNENEYAYWKFCHLNKWSNKAEDELMSTLTSLMKVLEDVGAILRESKIELPFDVEWDQIKQQWYAELVSILIQENQVDSNFLKVKDWKIQKEKVIESLAFMKLYLDTKNKLLGICKSEILQLNVGELQTLLEKSKNAFFIIKILSGMKLKKIFKPLLDDLSMIENSIALLSELNSMREEYENAESVYNKWFISDYELSNSDKYLENVNNADRYLSLLGRLYSESVDSISAAKSTSIKMFENQDLILGEGTELHKQCDSVVKTFEQIKNYCDKLINIFEFRQELIEINGSAFKDVLAGLKGSINKFRDICAMNSIRTEIEERGFGDLFRGVDSKQISISEMNAVFESNFYRHWLSERLEQTEVLENLSGKQLDLKDEEYKRVYKTYQDNVQHALVSQVSKDKPVLNNNILPNSPVGLIVKENKKSRKHLAIRKYLTEIDPVVKDLKPCFLMSPMSVSQYLEVSPQFDLVIFDEASQIPPWDAIGSMARGKQAVVVGDSKQLPPTSFFSANGEDEDDEKIDCESVLEMFATLYPEMLLRWHYRSRSESLISFSNYHIYNNRLHTFPSANTNDQKVSLSVVSGEDAYYDRGKSKTNIAEARSAVKEVFTRLEKAGCSKSIGIVTFSTPQSNLIEDLIDAEIIKYPHLEEYFNPNNEEYVFVKNLENVQGDERDVILFSIGYGKDRNGVINRNFGPLNNSGGERRLNVAVTRAREEVKIFANFTAREFDTGTSKSEGLALLKEYLTFAEDGHAALFKRQQYDDVDQFDSPFEEEVAKALRSKGWEVHTQIGVGGYRVDLGIVHPENKGMFLAGVECDGARYHSAKSARDRDILRQSVLEGLGWKILRIWSTDWWYDKARVLNNINQQLNDLVANKVVEVSVEVSVEVKPSIDISEEPEDESDEFVLDVSDRIYDPSIVKIMGRGEFFEAKSLVRDQIRDVVTNLAPISKKECFDIVRKGWGYARAGNQIRTFLEECSAGIYKTKSKKDHFFWKSEEQYKSFDLMRIPTVGGKRHPKDIAPEELINGMMPILKQNKDVEDKEMYRVICKQLGISSVSKETMEIMRECIDLLVERNEVNYYDNRIVLKDN